MPDSDTDTLSKLSSAHQKSKATNTNTHRRSPRASERHSTTARKRLSVSVSSQDSDSTEEKDIRSREGSCNKRRRLSDEDKQVSTRDNFRRSGSISSGKRTRVNRRDMSDSWVAPEATKRAKRVDMEWDTWIAPDLREGEERREKEAIARLRAKRVEKERKKRSRRTRYDARNMDTWIASDSPSTPEKHEHRERRRSPAASSCRESKHSQSLSPSKRDDTIKT